MFVTILKIELNEYSEKATDAIFKTWLHHFKKIKLIEYLTLINLFIKNNVLVVSSRIS